MKNNTTNTVLYKRLFLRFILIALFFLFIIYVLPMAIRILFPFFLAFIVAALINPLTTKINQHFGISRKVLALIIDLLIFLIISSLLGLLFYTIIGDIITLASNIQQNWDGILNFINGIEDKLSNITDLLPPEVVKWLSGFEESFFAFLQNASKALLNSAIVTTGTLTIKIGNFFIDFIMYILAAYFILVDYNRIASLAKKAVGERLAGYFSILKSSVLKALGAYIRSMLLLALFAFVFMLVAFLLYGQPYALLIALFLAFIDIFPVIGTIAILLPWGIVTLFIGDIHKGIFLIAIGIAFFVLRKLAEPKIVGSQTGLHPLLALISTYIGLQFLGVWGALLGPVLLMLCISIVKSGILDNTLIDLKELSKIISATLHKSSPKKDDDAEL